MILLFHYSKVLEDASRKSNIWTEKLTVTPRNLANSLKQPFCLLGTLSLKLSPNPELDFLTVALLGGLPILFECHITLVSRYCGLQYPLVPRITVMNSGRIRSGLVRSFMLISMHFRDVTCKHIQILSFPIRLIICRDSVFRSVVFFPYLVN